MKKYDYTAKDQQNRVNKGIIEATSRDDAALVLQKQGLTPFAISEKSEMLKNIMNLSLFERLSLNDKVLFCEEIATLVDAGVPLSQSISIISNQAEGTLKKVMTNVLKEIEGGQALSGALEKEPKHFSPVFVNMIKAGEASGKLDQSLKDLAAQTQKDQELVAKVKGALMYPVFIVVAMIGAIIYLMVKVVPKISELFTELDAELPMVTRVLIGTSNFTVKYGAWVLVAMVIIAIAISQVYARSYSLKRRVHLLLTKLPVFGNIIIKFNIARFSRTFGSLLSSGVSVLEALSIVSKSLKNIIFVEEIEKVAEKVKNGETVANPLKQSHVFPVMVTQMIGVGEETGNLDTMLLKSAEFYERQIDDITKNLSSILEPIIMLVVGVGIGFIVISIITPIYQATSQI